MKSGRWAQRLVSQFAAAVIHPLLSENASPFDVLEASFGLPRSTACEYAHCRAKALERTLRTQGALLARAIGSLAQMQRVCAEVPMLLDATERPVGAAAPKPWWTARPTILA